MNWLPLILAGIAGLLVSFINCIILRSMLKRKKTSGMNVVRTGITAVFMLALYFIGRALSLDVIKFIIAGAIGETIGLIAFSVLLTKKPNNDQKESKQL